MVFIDANIVYHKDHPEVTLATALAAFECGFDAVVLNYICTGRPDKSDKGIPDTFVEAIHRAISDRSTAAGARAAALRVLNPARPLLRVYKRLTMVIEEKSQAQGLGQQATYLTKAYDVIAVTPLSDSVFQEVFPRARRHRHRVHRRPLDLRAEAEGPEHDREQGDQARARCGARGGEGGR